MRKRIMEEIYPYLLDKIVAEIDKVYARDNELFELLTEIRLRAGKKCILKLFDNEYVLPVVVTSVDMEQMLEKLSNYSIYSIQNEINDGYITIKGGHRVGVCGTCVIEENSILNVKNISSMNIRIARQVIGCSDDLYNQLYENGFNNTLIISLPNAGKTTNIRDLTRRLSNRGYTITIIDERSEIACMYNKIPQMDVGQRTDVINKCPKHMGIRMAIRSLAPDIIVADEIGSKKDIEEITNAVLSGVKFLVTAHGNSIEEIKRGEIGILIEKKIFSNIVILKEKFKYEIWKES